MTAPAPDLRALGHKIARLRRAQGWSIERLAEAAGIHRKSIIQIEAGRVAARISTVHAIAHALGVPLPQLVMVLCEAHLDDVGVPTPLV